MSKLLDFMVRCANASVDDVTDELIRMADPEKYESREDMENNFTDNLGYNPMEYFDRKDLEKKFNEFVTRAPYSVQEQMYKKREIIIDSAINTCKDVNEQVLEKCLAASIKETTGWFPSFVDDTSLDDCIMTSVFGELEDSSEEDSDMEDYEDESEDDLDDEDDMDFQSSDDYYED